MDSIGDYIYLIIIIIAAVSGILKKKKPEAVLQTPQPKNEVEEDEIDNFFPVEKNEDRKVNFETGNQPLSYDTLDDFSALKAKMQVKKPVNTKNNVELIMRYEEDDKDSEYKFESLEDVKKAIIYTEIFNRKY